MNWERRTIIAAITFALAMPAVAEEKVKNVLPEKARAMLDKADESEFVSVGPMGEGKGGVKDGFHGWKVLGKTVVKDAKIRKEILESLYGGIKESDGNGAKCFDPRHGIRATVDGKTVDVVICFECGWIYVFYD